MAEASLMTVETGVETIERRQRKQRRQGEDRRDQGYDNFSGVARRMTLDRRKRIRDRRQSDQ